MHHSNPSDLTASAKIMLTFQVGQGFFLLGHIHFKLIDLAAPGQIAMALMSQSWATIPPSFDKAFPRTCRVYALMACYLSNADSPPYLSVRDAAGGHRVITSGDAHRDWSLRRWVGSHYTSCPRHPICTTPSELQCQLANDRHPPRLLG